MPYPGCKSQGDAIVPAATRAPAARSSFYRGLFGLGFIYTHHTNTVKGHQTSMVSNQSCPTHQSTSRIHLSVHHRARHVMWIPTPPAPRVRLPRAGARRPRERDARGRTAERERQRERVPPLRVRESERVHSGFALLSLGSASSSTAVCQKEHTNPRRPSDPFPSLSPALAGGRGGHHWTGLALFRTG